MVNEDPFLSTSPSPSCFRGSLISTLGQRHTQPSLLREQGGTPRDAPWNNVKSVLYRTTEYLYCHSPSYPLLHLRGGRKDSHMIEETKARRGERVSTRLLSRVRAGRRDSGDKGPGDVSVHTLGFFATVLRELIPTSLQRGNLLLGLLALVPSAVLGTESWLGERWPGRVLQQQRPRRQAMAGKGGNPAAWCWWQNPHILECQGQGVASSCGLWEASQKVKDMVRFIVLYQDQLGLTVVAGLDGG